MAKKPYLPRRDDELNEWLDNFITQLTVIAAQLGIALQEVTDATTLSDNFSQAINNVSTKDAEKRSAVGKKNEDKKAVAVFIRPLIQRIKNHPDYSPDNHGTLLGIIGPEDVIDLLNLKPELKIVLDAGRPRIMWQKGPADGIKISVDRRDGQGYRFLTLDTKPDYIDSFPIPEGKDSVVWDYKGIYIINDEEVGKISDVVSITVTK